MLFEQGKLAEGDRVVITYGDRVGHVGGTNTLKLLSVGAKILLFHDLTRGIDVGTKAEVFHLMRDLAAKGHAILFYSSENQELVNMCDRVLVLRGGRSMGTIAAASLSEERILQAAMGLAGSAVAA